MPKRIPPSLAPNQPINDCSPMILAFFLVIPVVPTFFFRVVTTQHTTVLPVKSTKPTMNFVVTRTTPITTPRLPAPLRQIVAYNSECFNTLVL